MVYFLFFLHSATVVGILQSTLLTHGERAIVYVLKHPPHNLAG